jgi:hypothetical protein
MKKSILLLLAVLMICGCFWKSANKADSNYTKTGAKKIAVMPIKNQTTDTKAAPILREKIISELYFKGYQKIPSGVIDEKLSSISGSQNDPQKGNIPSKMIGDQLGADAVLYCTLMQFKTTYRYLYAPTTVSISLELQNVKTGATLWSTSYETVKRSYGISKKQLEVGAIEIYEPAIEETLVKAMATLPDSSDI